MAVRLAGRLLSPSDRGGRTVRTLLLGNDVVGSRWAASRFSSSSSSDESDPKPRKKITDRLSAVIDAVNDRKLPPELRGQRNNVRSETDIINVVEQRIWHSMEEGHFENLPGKGKPLNLSLNPHADPAEDTLYRILSKNGCAPEWVELNKEIRNMISGWRSALKKAWKSRCSGDYIKWDESSEALKLQLRDVNDKVFRYNLIVPFGRQMFGLKWEKELDRLEEYYTGNLFSSSFQQRMKGLKDKRNRWIMDDSKSRRDDSSKAFSYRIHSISC